MFEISAKKGLRDIILGSEEKTSDLAAHFSLFTSQFWRCKYGFVSYSNVQRTLKDDKIKSTVFTRPHAMKRHKSIGPMLTLARTGGLVHTPPPDVFRG